MNRVILALPAVFAACAPVPVEVPAPDVAAPVETSAPPPPPPTARTVEEFDTTSAEDRAEALAVDQDGRFVGSDVASLGDPARPGFWIESNLIDEPGRGRVTLAGQDASVEVDLIPGDGGSRLSLAAIRVLGVQLTDLPTVEVYAF